MKDVKITIESEGKFTVTQTFKGYSDLTALVMAASQGTMSTIKHMMTGEKYPEFNCGCKKGNCKCNT